MNTGVAAATCPAAPVPFNIIFQSLNPFIMKNKNLLSLLALMLCAGFLNAQNVGIGTTNPEAKLHIKDGALRIENGGSSWELAYDPNGEHFYIDEFGVARHFVIGKGGNVSIGSTTISDATLALRPPNGNNRSLVFRAANDVDVFEVRTDGNSWALANASDGANFIGAIISGPTDRVRVYTDFFVTGSKNFIMDHPLNPANKSLQHSCMESPEVLNVYSGSIILDAEGKAAVNLPDYFEAINKDYRYQLTAIGGAAPQLHIAQEVNNNEFTIAGGLPGMKVSWEVTGVRNDPYFQDHPYQAVQEKPDSEKGRYYYPQGYGMPLEMGINMPAPENK